MVVSMPMALSSRPGWDPDGGSGGPGDEVLEES